MSLDIAKYPLMGKIAPPGLVEGDALVLLIMMHLKSFSRKFPFHCNNAETEQ